MIVHQDAAQVGFLQSAVEDDAPGSGNCDVSGGISIEKRITAKVDGEGTVRIAPEHLFKRDLVGDPRFVVTACPVCKGHRACSLQPGSDGWDLGGIRYETGGSQRRSR